MAQNVKWSGDRYFDAFEDEYNKRLERAAIFLKNEIKVDLSVGVTKKKGKPGRSKPGRSKPGEPPRLEFGELRRSMAHEVDKSRHIARVGTNKIYGKYLELGTRRMAKRPFLRPALAEHSKTLKHILTGGTISVKR